MTTHLHTDHDRIRHRALADERRARIVVELEESPQGLDAAELGRRVGLHANTVRWHLGILADAGVVGSRPEPRETPGRPRILYHIAAGEDPRGRDEHRLLATILAGLVPRGEEERCAGAGREWGRALVRGRAAAEPLEGVAELLEEQGFEPALEAGALEMRRCPFHDLAEASPDVVCAVHRGLVDGALEELGSTLRVSELQIFPRPGVCVAHFAPGPSNRPGTGP
jgi:predicted ArsR family transcriptional regulator